MASGLLLVILKTHRHYVRGAERVEELWKDIDGYHGAYEVSSTGRIRTRRRQGSDGRILKQRKARNGYFTVTLHNEFGYKTKQVHRLVAEAFIPNHEEYPCVNHKDENKENNAVENLEWCTYQYNNNYGTARYRASVARYKPCVGKYADGTEVRFNSCTLASKALGISQGNIWGACNGLWKRAGGLEWRYE